MIDFDKHPFVYVSDYQCIETDAIQTFNNIAKHGLILDGTKECQQALDLIEEEVRELLVAIDQCSDAELLKEMTDVVWVILSFCIRKGWNFEEAFQRLGKSNLSKFNQNPDGTYWAEYHPNGKVKKSINYKPPYLDDLVFTIKKDPQPLDMDKYPA